MIKNVIVQAGGLGKRAGKYARNKPKCLISIKGKPILFHICDQFPYATIHLILNESNEQSVKRFLKLHKRKINVIASSYSGESASIKDTLNLCNEPTLICWSDIIFNLPEFDESGDVVFVTNSIKCRWKIKDKIIQQNEGDGIFGCFYIKEPYNNKFNNEGCILDVLDNFNYTTVMVDDCQEFGNEEQITDHYANTMQIRYYNRVNINETTVEKFSQNAKIIDMEINWYNTLEKLGFKGIPKKIKDNPLTLEKKGITLYKYLSQGNTIDPAKVFSLLDELHQTQKQPFDAKELEMVFVDETLEKLSFIASVHEIFNKDYIAINNDKCINYAKRLDELADLLRKYLIYDQPMVMLHGDPNISNILIDADGLYMIDPRGRFGKGLLGTALYDFAKLYFSTVTNFDTFNQKLFDLKVTDKVEITIENRTHCSQFKQAFERKYDEADLLRIKILSSMIWLNHGFYVLDDYDSVIGSMACGLHGLYNLGGLC